MSPAHARGTAVATCRTEIYSSAVLTGTELIVWGGVTWDEAAGLMLHADGAALKLPGR